MKTEKEINDLVAIEVMGFTRSAHENLNFELMGWKTGENSWTSSFSPSKDISDAWQVVEKIGLWWGKGQWIVDNDLDDGKSIRWTFINKKGKAFSEEADTVPLAICLAALQAKGVDINKT